MRYCQDTYFLCRGERVHSHVGLLTFTVRRLDEWQNDIQPTLVEIRVLTVIIVIFKISKLIRVSPTEVGS